MTGCHNRSAFSLRSGGQRAEDKVSEGLLPSESGQENLSRGSLRASGGLLATFVIPWLAEASPVSTFLFDAVLHGDMSTCAHMSVLPLWGRWQKGLQCAPCVRGDGSVGYGVPWPGIECCHLPGVCLGGFGQVAFLASLSVKWANSKDSG